jgi:hypothetical protein
MIMTLQQVRKVIGETEYRVNIQLMAGTEDMPPHYDTVNLKYDGNIERHARDLRRLEDAKLAKVTNISVNTVTGKLEIDCVLGE